MQCWRERAVRGVWLKIPSNQSQLIPLAIAEGFAFHHAEHTHAMLTTWLPDTPSTLPPNASHQVGVGVVVKNARGDIVLVKEKSGPAAKYDIWKVPTGLLDEAEDFHEAAVREVKEETVRRACLLVVCLFFLSAAHKSSLRSSSLPTSSPTSQLSQAASHMIATLRCGNSRRLVAAPLCVLSGAPCTRSPPLPRTCTVNTFIMLMACMRLQGLDVVFDTLLAVRQAHGLAFGKSDIFMLCGVTLAPKYDEASTSGRPALQPCEQVRLLSCRACTLSAHARALVRSERPMT